MDFRVEVAPPQSPIERIWFARGPGGPRETILPDGRYELIFNFGDPVLQDGVPQPRAMLAAQTRRAVSIEPAGRADFVGVTLRDGRAAGAIGVPLREVRDRMLDLGDLGLDLYDRVGAAGDDRERVAVLVEAFRSFDADPLAETAASMIRRAAGRLSISRLAAVMGISIRTLARSFDRSIGITPKTLARVQRLNRAAALLQSGRPAAEAALEAGFFDQPHLVNEFRSMAGLSPSRWIEAPPGLGVQFLQESPAPGR
jgi:AraC-like DNA-binding protein